eukprot:NODE_6121_length_1703_cov_11.857234.p1 GENE.NODE_6121_length_1703_cov_11.857234~~NODE_6121_length_1703_cov_11.857234.p1  ORF type:complete len:524 (-),score=152.93 NODE_6121_length_1703_cov_11.857234:131-1474(-)
MRARYDARANVDEDLREAAVNAERGLEAAQLAGDKFCEGELWYCKAMVAFPMKTARPGRHVRKGPTQEFAAAISSARQVFRNLGNSPMEVTTDIFEASAELQTGNATGAAQELDRLMVRARRIGYGGLIRNVLSAQLEVDIAQNDLTQAYSKAQAEVEREIQAGNLRGELSALTLVLRIHSFRNEGGAALKCARRHVELARALGDEREVAVGLQVVSSLMFDTDRLDEAVEPGEEALAYFERANLSRGCEAARRTLSDIHARTGNTAMAPNRAITVSALKGLAKAVEQESEESWWNWLAMIDKCGGLMENDLQDYLDPAIGKDRPNATKFLRSVGYDIEEFVPPMVGLEFPLPYLHVLNRVGGIMGFGPRYRITTEIIRGEWGLDAFQRPVMCILTAGEEEHTWESEVMIPTTQMDAMLQATLVSFPKMMSVVTFDGTAQWPTNESS